MKSDVDIHRVKSFWEKQVVAHHKPVNLQNHALTSTEYHVKPTEHVWGPNRFWKKYSLVLQYSETSWLQERNITLSGVHSRTPSYKKKRNQLRLNWVTICHIISVEIEDRKSYNSLRKETSVLTRIAGRLALRDSLLAYRRSKNSRTSAQRPKG